MSASRLLINFGLVLLVMFSALLQAVEIVETYPAALDQPRINAVLRRTPGGSPIVADFGGGITTINVQAFFDTGASGLLLSDQTATFMGIQKSRFPEPAGPLVVFSDVGVGGSENFHVSEPVYVGLAPFRDLLAGENPNYFETASNYTQNFGPIRMQMSAPATNPLLEGLDVFGMPVFAGKVVVIDPRPADPIANLGLGTMNTFVYNPGTPFNPNTVANPNNEVTNPGIPSVTQQIKLSYGNFEQFTTVTPSAAPGPTLAHNPFIGPNPVLQLLPVHPVDTTPPVTINFGTRTTTGSFLLDTGAGASMISTSKAASLAIRYRAGTLGTETPKLESYDPLNPLNPGTLLLDQFSLQIGGVGGLKTVAGFYLDTLLMKSEQGNLADAGDPNHLRYRGAPVLVNDITVLNPLTNQSLTLDGIIGMNLFGGSADIDISNPTNPFLGLANGAYNWLVFDEPNGKLGVQTKSSFAANQWGLAGSGNWGTAANWTGNVIPNSTTSDALLGQNLTGSNQIDLGNNDRTVSGLRFDNNIASYTVQSTGTGKLLLESASGPAVLANLLSNTQNHLISAPAEFRSSTTVYAGGQTISFTGPLTFSNNVVLQVESGTLALNVPTNSVVGTNVTANVSVGATLSLGGAGNALDATVNVTNNGTLNITTAGKAVGNINGTGTTSVNGTGTLAAPTLTANYIRQGALSIGDNATVMITNDLAVHPAVSAKTSVVDSLTLGTGARLDLKNNDLIINNVDSVTAATTLNQVKNAITSGSAAVWTGVGITSSTAGANVDNNTGLGYFRNTLDGTTPIQGNFNGISVDIDSVVVKYTYIGDADLDGDVDDDDYTQFGIGYGTSGVATNPWYYGDFDHDGDTDDDDYSKFGIVYSSNPLPILSGGGIQAIPEPSTWVLGTLVALGLGAASIRKQRG